MTKSRNEIHLGEKNHLPIISCREKNSKNPWLIALQFLVLVAFLSKFIEFPLSKLALHYKSIFMFVFVCLFVCHAFNEIFIFYVPIISRYLNIVRSHMY